MADSRPVPAPAARTLAARAAVRALRDPGTDGHLAAADLPELLAMRAELDAAITARLTVVDRTETWQQTGARAQWSWLAQHALTPASDPDTDPDDPDHPDPEPDGDGPGRGRPGGAGPSGERPAPMGKGAAQAWIALARDLAVLPAVRDAHASGRLSTEHARVLGRALRELARVVVGTPWNTPEWLTAQERAVLRAARFADPVRLRKELTARLQALAPLPAAADAEKKRAKRHARLTPGYDGMWNLTALLDPESGQLLHEALLAWRRGDHTTGDTRTPAQRDADALTALAQQFLAAGLTTQRGVTPHVIVHVPLARMQAHEAAGRAEQPDPFRQALIGDDGQPVPVATWADGTPVPESTLARYLCTGRLTRLVLDADSRPLDLGRTQRTFSWSQWVAAMRTWDEQCAVEGCHAPPSRLELHHATWWRDGGTTDLDNCIPLCHGSRSCHTRVHDGHTLHLRDGRLLDRRGLHHTDDSRDHRARTSTQSGPRPAGNDELRRVRPDQLQLAQLQPPELRADEPRPVPLLPRRLGAAPPQPEHLEPAPPTVVPGPRADHQRHRTSPAERHLADLLHQHGLAA